MGSHRFSSSLLCSAGEVHTNPRRPLDGIERRTFARRRNAFKQTNAAWNSSRSHSSHLPPSRSSAHVQPGSSDHIRRPRDRTSQERPLQGSAPNACSHTPTPVQGRPYTPWDLQRRTSPPPPPPYPLPRIDASKHAQDTWALATRTYASFDSSFQNQEWIAYLLHHDAHDVQAICAIPEVEGDGMVEPDVWVYEHMLSVHLSTA